MKLYASHPEPVAFTALESSHRHHLQVCTDLSSDLAALECHHRAYESLDTVYQQVASEQFSFLDKGNYVLYNEYMKSISEKIGITPMVISQEMVATLPSVALNHHIALEGFIATVWQKIKDLFAKIYTTVKQFFAGIFTRLGRLKKKLQNLQEVLSETDKDLRQVILEKVPGSLASRYPVADRIGLETVQEVFANIAVVREILEKVNQASTELASKEILDKNFVAKIKSLRDKAKSAKDSVAANDEKKTEGLKSLYGKGRANNKAIDKDNRSLQEIAKTSEAEASQLEDSAGQIAADNPDLDTDDQGFEAAKKEFSALLQVMDKEFARLKNKPLVNGKTITGVTIDEDTGIELDISVDKEIPESCALGSKADLLPLVKSSVQLLTAVEGSAKSYGAINDTVMKNMSTIDTLIKEIDAIQPEALGKYKNVLQSKVKERLKLMKTFFTNYNKINKNLFELVVESLEGNAEYAITSLKYFG